MIERLNQRLNLSTVAPTPDITSSDVPAAESTVADESATASRAVDAINQFALDLYEHLQGEEGNLVVSPSSIATALAMVYAGARGNTEAEIANVLNIENAPGIHDSFQMLLEQLRGDQAFELAIANALWLQAGFSVHNSFPELIESKYAADVGQVDFRNPATVDVVNDWVSENTREMITKLFESFPDGTKFVLSNAIYFNATWETEFDPSDTHELPFYLSEDQQIDVSTMRVDSDFRYTEMDGLQVLELPYAENDASMIVMLPARGAGNHVTAETIRSVNDWLATDRLRTQVDVRLPKFKNTVSSDLNSVLAGMGMPTAFIRGSADLSGIAPDPRLHITHVLHKAVVEVDEQGTEAAAVTGVVGGIGCFAAGTPVRTFDGSKPIDQLQPGDHVLARDEHDVDGDVESKRVEEVFERQSPLIELHVQGKVIETTAEHPFYVKDRGWTTAADLKVGDQLSSDDGRWIELEKSVITNGYRAVYNVAVADHHTYFIGDDDWSFSIWSHNVCGAPIPTPVPFVADRPFHYIIRDNRTDAILFMGRVNDPQGADNAINPKVSNGDVNSSDVNVDGNVSGLDALIIINHLNNENAERSHDLAGTNMNMDTNGDGDVTAADALFVINQLQQENTPAQISPESEWLLESDKDDFIETFDLVLQQGLF